MAKDPKKSKDVPVTVQYVDGVEARINKRFTSLEQKIDSIKSDLSSQISQVLAKVNEVLVTVQAQEDRNLYVPDGYTSLYDNQKDTKERLKKVEHKVFGIDKGN